MRAVQYDEYGGVDVLRVAEVPVPAARTRRGAGRGGGGGHQPRRGLRPRGALRAALALDVPVGAGERPRGHGARARPRRATPSRSATRCSGGPTRRASQAEYVVVPGRQVSPKPSEWRGSRPGRCTSSGPRPGPPCARSTRRPGETVVVSGRGGRGRRADRAAGPPDRRHGRRHGVRGEPRLAARARRRPRGATATGWSTGSGAAAPTVDAFIDPLRRRLRRRRARRSACRRTASTRSSTSPPSRSTA